MVANDARITIYSRAAEGGTSYAELKNIHIEKSSITGGSGNDYGIPFNSLQLRDPGTIIYLFTAK